MSYSTSERLGFGEKSHRQPSAHPNDRSTTRHEYWDKELWEREYGTLKIIPSSTRTLPSKALVLFSEILHYENMKTVLDAGCGIGRNAIYLARKGCDVHALDFSETALRQLSDAAVKEAVTHKIHMYNCSLQRSFPFKDNSFDLALDSYVFCHFTDEGLKPKYRSELYRVTKPGGFVFSSVFSVEDSYYREMPNGSDGRNSIVVDPNNGIKKQLYTESEIKRFFAAQFKILYFVKFEFDDIVLGQTYGRSILVLVLKK